MQIAVFINHAAACKRSAKLTENCKIVPVYRRGALLGYSVYQIKSQCWIMEP